MRRSAVAAAVLAVLVLPGAVRVSRAADECRPAPGGYECIVDGTIPGGTTPPGSGDDTDPLRYLKTRTDRDVGECWYWGRRPPGLDAWDPANDAAIINTRWRLPACPDAPGADPGDDAAAIAWRIYREFPLEAPVIRLQPPSGGITGLAVYLSVDPPPPLSHHELLPGGGTLVVEAWVEALGVDWGDGSPAESHDPASASPYPDGAVTHVYVAKTCDPGYRAGHPSGPNCHPGLVRYPIEATFTWRGRYRYLGSWLDLGPVERPAAVEYDVDEVLGVLER